MSISRCVGHGLESKKIEAVLTGHDRVRRNGIVRGAQLRSRYPAGVGSIARIGLNPANDDAIKIKASKKITSRPAKELKEAV